MKKLMTLAAVAAIAIGAYGKPPKHAPKLPEDSRAAAHLAAARAYVTNDAVSAVGYAAFHHYTNAALYAEMDAVLAAKPPLFVLCCITTNRAVRYPRTYAAALEAYAATKPNLVKFVRPLGRFSAGALNKRPPAERVAVYVEKPLYDAEKLREFRTRVGAALGKLIVPTLRKQGKAVTTGPDGRSPVKEYADRISAALDAPRFAGLQEILDEMGIDAKIDLSYLPPDEKVAALRDAILAGTRPLTKLSGRDISLCLGTAAYNAFVEAYNGGTRE